MSSEVKRLASNLELEMRSCPSTLRKSLARKRVDVQGLEPLEGLQQQLSESKALRSTSAVRFAARGRQRTAHGPRKAHGEALGAAGRQPGASDRLEGPAVPDAPGHGPQGAFKSCVQAGRVLDLEVKKKASELYSVVEQRFSMLPSQLEEPFK